MKVHRVGNSLMVSIPADIARRLDLHEGDEVEAEMDDAAAALVVRPRRSARELLAGWEPLGKPAVMRDVVDLLHEERESH